MREKSGKNLTGFEKFVGLNRLSRHLGIADNGNAHEIG
jgi:hypothetical protein